MLENKTLADVFIKEIIPMVDKEFRTIADRDHRAIAGLSMGGFQAYMIGMTNLDKFAYIAGFSGGGFVDKDGGVASVYGGVFNDANSHKPKSEGNVHEYRNSEESKMLYETVNNFHKGLEKGRRKAYLLRIARNCARMAHLAQVASPVCTNAFQINDD